MFVSLIGTVSESRSDCRIERLLWPNSPNGPVPLTLTIRSKNEINDEAKETCNLLFCATVLVCI